MHITIQDLSKSFGGKELFTNFSQEVFGGMRLCVCGPNGCGKSTLIKLLAGVEAPDSGRIIIPKECRLGYVEQELSEEKLTTELLAYVLDVLPDWNSFWEEWEHAAQDPAKIQALTEKQADLERLYGYNPEHRAKAVLSGLGFSEDAWDKPLKELSGGWRERAKLARILTGGTDFLLLDEPTNHLDLEAVDWLESFLLDYQGALVFVAHDRVFMDNISTHVLYFGGGEKPVFRKGNFTKFIALQEELEEQRSREATRLQDEIEKKMDFVRRFKAKASKARQASSHQKMAKRLEKELDGLHVLPKQRELAFKWPEASQADRTVLTISNLSFSFPDGHSMWKAINCNIYRGQRVALVGPNGCGKSTLLKLIMGQLEKDSGQISMGQLVKTGYYSQHQLETLQADGSALNEIRRLSDPRTTEEELMSVLGLFMLGQGFFERRVESLSGGEKSRLMLAVLFLARSNFLILDEPTNHLDLESREALIEALASYNGSLLMVAHDRHLLSEVADVLWEVTPNGLVEYSSFVEYTAARKANAVATQEAEKQESVSRTSGLSREDMRRLKREQAEARNKLHREMKPLQDAYNKLEQKLEKLLQQQEEAEQQLAQPEVYEDGAHATTLLKEYHTLQEQTEALLEQLAHAEEELAVYEAKRQALMEEV